MKAILCHNDGSRDILRYEEVEKPVPAENEVLLKICAASVNPMDGFPVFVARSMRAMAWLHKPKTSRLGTDVAGRIEAVGGKVTQFKPGDAVFGTCEGAFAEYACVRPDRLVLKPAAVPFEQAAGVPVAGITALQALRDKGGIRPGQKVAVDGASGGVGTFAVQLAKSFGAGVTAVCSTRNVDAARALGAEHVIDYTREDFTRSGQRYDLIVGANAYHSIFAYRRALNPGGTYILAGGSKPQVFLAMLLGPLLSKMGGRKSIFMGIAELNQKDLLLLKELLEAGKIKTVIDRRYPLSATPEALRYLEEGHARGKIVVTVETDHKD